MLVLVCVIAFISVIQIKYFNKSTYFSRSGNVQFSYYRSDKQSVWESEGRILATTINEKYHVHLTNHFNQDLLEIGIFEGTCDSVIYKLVNEGLYYLNTPAESGKNIVNNGKMIKIYNMKNVPDQYMLFFTKLACIENDGKVALIGGVRINHPTKLTIANNTYDYLMFKKVVETFEFIK